MAKLAEIGFTQSYTYFTWRTSRGSCASTSTRSPRPPLADYMRPNFWPNTPDILYGPLRHGPPSGVPAALPPRRDPRAQLRDLQRLRAVRERARQRHQRGVPALREVRAPSARLQEEPSIAPLVPHRERDPSQPPRGVVAAERPVPPSDNESFLAYTRATWTATWCSWSSTSTRTTPRRPCCASTSARSACPQGPYHLHDELTGDRYIWEGDARTCGSTPTPARSRTSSRHGVTST